MLPRLYMTPNEINESVLGVALSNQISSLSSGVVDKMLAKASQKCDSHCRKRLQAPGTSTLSQLANAGATSISVASTLTLDNLDEQAVIINPNGGNQETVIINPGGVNTTTWASPYPGTISLASGLQFNHSSGETVQYVYKEVSEVGSASSSDPYTEALQTQTMQLALAHLPPAQQALTRVIFTKTYPIISLIQLEHAFSFTNQFNAVDMTIESIVPSEGWARFNVGSVILREGLMRITYSAGYVNVVEDIKDATMYYFAEDMRLMSNPTGATRMGMGKRNQEWRENKDGDPPLVAEAKKLLRNYRKTV